MKKQISKTFPLTLHIIWNYNCIRNPSVIMLLTIFFVKYQGVCFWQIICSSNGRDNSTNRSLENNPCITPDQLAARSKFLFFLIFSIVIVFPYVSNFSRFVFTIFFQIGLLARPEAWSWEASISCNWEGTDQNRLSKSTVFTSGFWVAVKFFQNLNFNNFEILIVVSETKFKIKLNGKTRFCQSYVIF